MSIRPLALVFCALALLTVGQISEAAKHPFTRNQIIDARFNQGDLATLLQKSYNVAHDLDQKIYNQAHATRLTQDILIRYFSGFGQREREPLYVNYMGLPGVGKTDIPVRLKELGFPVVQLDSQNYLNSDRSFSGDVSRRLDPYLTANKPVILVVDEIDKLAELQDLSLSMPLNRPSNDSAAVIIGALNNIVSEGRLAQTYSGPLDLSNVLIMTTMNFAPGEVTDFSKQALKAEKTDFYDFTVDDFQKFIEWLHSSPGARPKVLAKLFRHNTVGRIATDSIIMNALDWPTLKKIAEQKVDLVNARYTRGKNKNRHLTLSFDPGVAEFLAATSAFAPSGARGLKQAESIVEQLVLFGEKAGVGGDSARPRKIDIRIKEDQTAAVLRITPQSWRAKKLVDLEFFEVEILYSKSDRIFLPPLALQTTPPPRSPSNNQGLKRGPTQEEIRKARFPSTQSQLTNVAKLVNNTFYGQKETVALINSDMRKYLGRAGSIVRDPQARVLVGFPGVGKSGIIRLYAELLGLPLVKINMQTFSGDTEAVAREFLETISREMRKAKELSGQDKVVLLLDELDKAAEFDLAGKEVKRAAMGVAKDLLSDGVARMAKGGDNYKELVTVDIRNAYTVVTMNFGASQFGFEGDPRLTTIEDVYRQSQRLKKHPADIRSLLGRMFLPDTVNRLIARVAMTDALQHEDYEHIIFDQINLVVKERLIGADGVNRGQIEVEPTDAYLKYVFADSVVPSEGGRYAAIAARTLISSSLEIALDHIPHKEKYATKPLILRPDFNEATQEFSATVEGTPAYPLSPRNIVTRKMPRMFPSRKTDAPMDPSRIFTATHEFGHAFVGALMGLRIQHISAISISADHGGFVSFKNPEMDGHLFGVKVGRLVCTLAGRAFERMFMNDDPLSPISVSRTSAGASIDFTQATLELHHLLQAFGFDPNGGNARINVTASQQPVFEPLPAGEARKYGLVLRDLETFMIKDLLAMHDREWYAQKIAKLAQEASSTEQDFYKLIEVPYPGDNDVYLFRNSVLTGWFKDFVKPAPPEHAALLEYRWGKSQRVLPEHIESYSTELISAIARRLHDPCVGALTAPDSESN